MTDAQARSVVAGIALILCTLIAALAWGRAAVDVVLVVGFLWLLWDRITLHDRTDGAIDDADQAIGRIEAVENHLTGLEPASTGRHATALPATWKTTPMTYALTDLESGSER